MHPATGRHVFGGAPDGDAALDHRLAFADGPHGELVPPGDALQCVGAGFRQECAGCDLRARQHDIVGLGKADGELV